MFSADIGLQQIYAHNEFRYNEGIFVSGAIFI